MEQKWLRAIEEWAEQTPTIKNVYIVGSRAKGKATKESDLDVAVQLVDGANLGDWIFLSDQWRAELQPKLDVKLHLLRGTEDLGNPTIADAVKDHGVTVYARKESG